MMSTASSLLWNELDWIGGPDLPLRHGYAYIDLPDGLTPTNFVVAPNGDCTASKPWLSIWVTERHGSYEIEYDPPFGRKFEYKFTDEVGAICCLEELGKKFFRAATRLHKLRSRLSGVTSNV
jgi:hypothetical protein